MKKKSWSEISDRPFSESAIREQCVPAACFRFFPNRFGPGVKFPETVGQPLRVFVLSGRCAYEFEDGRLSVGESEFVDLEAGRHWFEVEGNQEVKLLTVFRMPENMQ